MSGPPEVREDDPFQGGLLQSASSPCAERDGLPRSHRVEPQDDFPVHVFGPRLPQCLYRRSRKLSGPLGNNPCVKDVAGRQHMVCGARAPQSAMHDDGMCRTSLRTLVACQWKEIPKLYATLAQTSFQDVVAGSVWPRAFGALWSACQHVLVVGIVFFVILGSHQMLTSFLQVGNLGGVP